tara:strand:+ start:223 stop:798 length:576 start_codon:yes stop_codon:yes gene_type:complete
MNKFRALLFLVFSIFFVNVVCAQDTVEPGEQVKTIIVDSTSDDSANDAVVQQAVAALLSGDVTGLSEEAIAYLEANENLLVQLLALIDANTTGFDLAAAGMALYPDNAENVAIITLILFPSNRQEVYNLALQTGAFTSPEDAQIALVSAGVDVSGLSETAAGGDALTAAADLPTGTDDTTPGAGGDTISAN